MGIFDFFRKQPLNDAEALFEERTAEYESSEIGTPTVWEPYCELQLEPIPEPAVLQAAVDRYWTAFVDLREVYHRNIERNSNEYAHAPDGFPGDDQGFLLFDPNAPLLRFSEIPRLLRMPLEEIRATLPPVKFALLIGEDGAEPPNSSEYWLPFLCRLTVVGTDCTVFEFRNGNYLAKEEYPPFIGELITEEHFTNALWLSEESTNLLRRLYKACVDARRTEPRMSGDAAYDLVRRCATAIFYERLQQWEMMEWPCLN